MHANRTPLYVIGIFIAIGIVAVIAYAVTKNGTAPGTVMHQETSESDSKTESADAVSTDQVKIMDYAFTPATITVKTGTKVTWMNQDSVGHTVTSTDEAPDKIDSGLFGKDETFSFTFTKAGTYQYYCEPHPYMKGTVIVAE